MRWKLLLLASLLATVISTGAILGIMLFLFGSTRRFTSPDIAVLSTFIIPVIVITTASIFVYRHTARRRKLQAMATALLSVILTLSFIIAYTMLTAQSQVNPEPRPARRIAMRASRQHK